ncbi:MAG: cohesin domain-containing protein, partial [Candidatus Bathyarchaeia archaeon]
MKNEKFPLVIVVIFLLAASLGSITRTYAQPTALSIKPPEVTVEPEQEFTVDVNVTDVQNMYAYEFKIFYKNSVLNATKAVRPPGHFMEPSDPTLQFIPKWEIKNNFNATHGRIWLGFTLLAPEAPKSGSGILVRITFMAIGEGTTLLSLKDTKLADGAGAPIPHVAEDCSVTVKLPEIPQPTMEVDPKLVSPTRRGEIMAVNVSINDLDVRWKAVGFEFKLGFNSTLLQVVNVLEGPFLKQFGETYMIPPVITSKYVLLGILLLPHEDGHWVVYPNGSGTLVTILFNVTHGPPVSANLTLYDTKIADITATPPGVPHTAVSGEYKFLIETLTSTIAWT